MRLVFGVGLNDAEYPVSPVVNGKRIQCPFYRTWKSMLCRCYSEKYQLKYPTYIGCSVYLGWHTFSNFKVWMETQDWEGKQLDKDLLVPGNKIYSPETCLFVSGQVNNFMISADSIRGEWPVGVSWHKGVEKFMATCHNLGKGQKHLGYFDSPDEASDAYWTYKCRLAEELAKLQIDERVATKILIRYSRQTKHS